MTSKLTVLGCGGSLGVPNVMGRHGECDMNNPKNFRSRTSAWAEHDGKNFLIDTSPDLRTQLLRENMTGIAPDAVLYTHAHADHCHGIDDLRPYYWNNQTQVNIYGHETHINELQERFRYQFDGSGENALYKPILKSNILAGGSNIIADTEIQVIEMTHGDTPSMGYRFGDIAWCTDFKIISDAGMKALAGVKIWFAAVSDWTDPHPSHASLAEVIALSEKLGSPQTYLIHLNPRFDYDVLNARTPSHVTPAHDGLVVESR